MAQNNQQTETGLQLNIPGMDQFKNLKFLQSETNPSDLVVQLPDGSEVVFPNYIVLAQAGAAPAITLEDGTVVPGQEIVSLIADLDYDLIAPAAGNDVVGPQTGGGAGFSDPNLTPDDDIGHGPYANRIEIADDVGFEQLPGSTGDSGGGGEEVPVISRTNNVGDDYLLMQETSVGLGDRPESASGDFAVELETFAPQQLPSLPFPFPSMPPVDDWDGMTIYLRAGETVTINHHMSEGVSLDSYYVALDTDGSAFPVNDPLLSTGKPLLGWEYLNFDGSISYVSDSDGWVYVGTGFPSTTTPGAYYTEVVVDHDNVLTGTDGHDILVGGNGAEVLLGGAGDDLLVGGAGDDLLTGGSGSDQFRFESQLDGHDTITDFLTGVGGDVVNLDALFDALSIVPAAREVLVNDSGADAILTIGDGLGNPLAAASGFSVTLLGDAGDTEASLLGNGNLVVDES